jgi:hexosaminidase
MMRHLKRVLGILGKYGFQAMMWSDMFASVLNPDGTLQKEKILDAPQNVTLVYWDYYSQNEGHYDAYMALHRLLPNPLSFATACWKWSGYTPQNRLSFLAQKPAFAAAIKNSISNVIVTAWGDNGGETSPFAVLPSMLFASLARQGGEGEDPRLFKAMTAAKLETYLQLDDANLLFPSSIKANTQNKAFLLMDPLLSPFDSLVPEQAGRLYRSYAQSLHEAKTQAGDFTYLFATQEALASLLSVKVSLGLDLRSCYQKGDRNGLREKQKDIAETKRRLRLFLRVYERQWLKENKPEGFEVQSLRLGGLLERLSYAERALRRYLSGKTATIDELEIPLLDYYGKDAFTKPDDNCEYRWRRLSSVGVNE